MLFILASRMASAVSIRVTSCDTLDNFSSHNVQNRFMNRTVLTMKWFTSTRLLRIGIGRHSLRSRSFDVVAGPSTATAAASSAIGLF